MGSTIDLMTAKTIEAVSGKVTVGAASAGMVTGTVFDWMTDNWAAVGSFAVALIALCINTYWKRRIALSIIKRNESGYNPPVQSASDLEDFDKV